jgi:hypothetical protein
MDAKISPNFWADMEEHPMEVKLTFLWALSNPETAASMLGLFTWRPRRFTCDTGLEPSWFLRTVEALPRAFVMIGDRVWLRHFIAYQLGRGAPLIKNRTFGGLVNRFEALPKPFHTPILEEYPEFQGHVIPLQSPLKGFGPVDGESVVENDPGAKRSPDGAELHPLPKGQRREEKRRVPPSGVQGGAGPRTEDGGRTEGAGAEVPTEGELLEFARAWAGDLARAIPPVIPEVWALDWFNWHTNESGRAFPRDWRAAIVGRFRSDWVKNRPHTRHVEHSWPATPAATAAELEAALAKEKDPQRRLGIIRRLKELPPNV